MGSLVWHSAFLSILLITSLLNDVLWQKIQTVILGQWMKEIKEKLPIKVVNHLVKAGVATTAGAPLSGDWLRLIRKQGKE